MLLRAAHSRITSCLTASMECARFLKTWRTCSPCLLVWSVGPGWFSKKPHSVIGPCYRVPRHCCAEHPGNAVPSAIRAENLMRARSCLARQKLSMASGQLAKHYLGGLMASVLVLTRHPRSLRNPATALLIFACAGHFPASGAEPVLITVHANQTTR